MFALIALGALGLTLAIAAHYLDPKEDAHAES